jgi:hypothetical protein
MNKELHKMHKEIEGISTNSKTKIMGRREQATSQGEYTPET